MIFDPKALNFRIPHQPKELNEKYRTFTLKSKTAGQKTKPHSVKDLSSIRRKMWCGELISTRISTSISTPCCFPHSYLLPIDSHGTLNFKYRGSFREVQNSTVQSRWKRCHKYCKLYGTSMSKLILRDENRAIQQDDAQDENLWLIYNSFDGTVQRRRS